MIKAISKLILSLTISIWGTTSLLTHREHNLMDLFRELYAFIFSVYSLVVVCYIIGLIYSFIKWNSRYDLPFSEAKTISRDSFNNKYGDNAPKASENRIQNQVASTVTSLVVQHTLHMFLPGLGFLLYPLFFSEGSEYKPVKKAVEEIADRRKRNNLLISIQIIAWILIVV